MSLTPSGNPEHLKANFWIVCLDTQVWELREALAKNDFRQFEKELVDCVLVGLDALRLCLGKDAFNSILERAVANISKFTPEALAQAPRDTDWYLVKIEKIKESLGQKHICECPNRKCSWCHN